MTDPQAICAPMRCEVRPRFGSQETKASRRPPQHQMTTKLNGSGRQQHSKQQLIGGNGIEGSYNSPPHT